MKLNLDRIILLLFLSNLISQLIFSLEHLFFEKIYPPQFCLYTQTAKSSKHSQISKVFE